MPKRSSEEQISYYTAKIKRLKKQQLNKKSRRRRIIISSSDSENNTDNETHDDPSPQSSEMVQGSHMADETMPDASDQRPPTAEQIISEPLDLPAPVDPELDSELLEALGDAAEETPVYGPKIHATLAQRWLPILKKGLLSDQKDKLLKCYAVPENCKLLKAPTVNPELKAAVTDIAKNRDKKIQIEQDQLGLGITAMNRAMTVLLTQDNKVEAVKILSDGCRILSDLHFTQTELRKKLITRGLDKAFLINIHEQERDETLFGITLPDKIKESKAIEKQSKDIRKTQTPKLSTSNATPQPPVLRSRFQGNWSGPPRYQTSSRGARSLQYRNQYQYRGGPLTLTPPAFPTSSHPTPRLPPSSSTTAGSRRAPTRH